jgi:hypothetical protein
MKNKFIGLLLATLVIGLPLTLIQKCQNDTKRKREERKAEIESEREAKIIRERFDSLNAQQLVNLANDVVNGTDSILKNARVKKSEGIEKFNNEQKALKPSLASLANDIDPNSDYGKLIKSIINKEYGKIDAIVFDDFYTYIEELKTKTNDQGVKDYLIAIQKELNSLAPVINQEQMKNGGGN